MPVSVIMPALEMAQDSGKIVSWKKKEGESVRKGEVLLEIETDKAVVEIEALADGVLSGVKAHAGEVIPVGETIAWILGTGELVPADSEGNARAAQAPEGLATPVPQRPTSATTQRIKMSPKARRIALEKGVDIGSVRGSGSEGEILVSDVLAAADSSTPSVPLSFAVKNSRGRGAVETGPLSSTARLMAERTTQSWTTVPHFFLTGEVEATRLNEMRANSARFVERSVDARLTHTDVLIGMVARVLERHPRVNASWAGQAIRFNKEINVGIAVAVDDGVVTGVIRDANQINETEIARQRREIVDRAREGRLRPRDITGATFTISNLGMHHVSAFTAIIVPPQAAILAVGQITDRAVAVEGKLEIRPMLTITLSCDHRVVDGVRAAQFMDALISAMR